MSNHLKRFTNHDNYNAHISTGAAVLPNVCVCDNESEIHYNELKLITFIINSVQYQAVEGMTWGDWVNSKYNINNIYSIHEDTIWSYWGKGNQAQVAYVVSSDVIISKKYNSYHSGGTND